MDVAVLEAYQGNDDGLNDGLLMVSIGFENGF